MTTGTTPRSPALSPSASLRLPSIERWLDRIEPTSVLEAGSGMGAMAFRLAGRFDYRGYEPDPTSFATASARLAELGRGEVRNEMVPLEPDRTFDLVVAFEVLEHIEDDRGTLAAWSRWLQPGGHVMISVPAHPERYGPCDEMAGHCRRYDRAGLAEVFRSAGLETLSIESWGMPLGYLLEAGRNVLARRRLDGAVGTAGSGRFFQPPASLGRSVEILLRPAALLQKPFRGSERGIGYVAVGRLPSPSNRG
ncbi:MAG TPA: class I SAM-dependent methyltransferase [Acidimicrobiia bacterium]|nr:class I SAM-dependent methyltransferase [Acidimicrobiia bacterium]